MLIQFLQRHTATRKFIFNLGEQRAHDTLGHFAEYLHPGETVLDIGAGTCNVALLLQDRGYNVTPLDVADLSFTPRMHPQLYDGTHLPFAKNQFDTALILTVLHHVPANQHDAILQEAARVAKRIIIIEDVHSSWLHKQATMFMDSLFNLEFIGHPHSNKTDAQWRATFKRLGFKITHLKSMRSFGVLRHRMYMVEPQ